MKKNNFYMRIMYEDVTDWRFEGNEAILLDKEGEEVERVDLDELIRIYLWDKGG
ncbi:MAG: hypothetical protein ACOCP8_04500 [archaeon]